ncbi:hypothetical protein B0H15DRAFT_191810 [Mycena belliarum]|uniref:RNase H type-1 domain-containing protein n=1 Tax=Mycena belliarum TaxID=1033014 RepID=A0AAD6XVU1_9AGAR|nr:hypothetical protein B0H15DRAFT_191810 [Mycena belliae]
MKIAIRLGLGSLKSISAFSTRAFSTTVAPPAPRRIPPHSVRPPISHEIARSKPAAKHNAMCLVSALREFTVWADGSAIDDGVGAAARAMTPFGTLVKRAHLGPRSAHTPAKAELFALVLALRIVNSAPVRALRLRRVTLLTDCQQAIRATCA